MWNSIKEKSPPHNHWYYLCFLTHVFQEKGKEPELGFHLMVLYYSDGKWYWIDRTTDIWAMTQWEVTHWMEMPDPPEQVEIVRDGKSFSFTLSKNSPPDEGAQDEKTQIT